MRTEIPKTIILRNKQAPGDVLMLSAAIRDLHRCYPGKFIVGVETSAPAVFENSPYVTDFGNKRPSQNIRLGYPLIHKSNQCGLHFLQGFIGDINTKLKLNVRLTEFRPDLHWSEKELKTPLVEGNYWVILSGGKADFTTKWWDPSRYQQVVDALAGKVSFVQIGNRPDGGGAKHTHPPLSNVVNLVGKTSLREAFRLIKHAKGVVCPVTCFMHVAAAVGIPAVVVAGGREPVTWEAYTLENLKRNMAYAAGLCKQPVINKEQWEAWNPNTDDKFVDHPFVEQVYLHSVGQLDCCRSKACWKTKVTEGRKEQNCTNVVSNPGCSVLPKCLDIISVDDVVNGVLSYSKNEASNVKDLKVTIEEKVQTKAISLPPVTKAETKQLLNEHFEYPITICGITYGDSARIAVRCLKSIYSHIDQSKFKLRYGFNEASPGCKKAVQDFLASKSNVEKLYYEDPQLYKYPLMRKMFHDPELPLSTKWVMWFDDDSHIVSGDFLSRLQQTVNQNYDKVSDKAPKGVHMYGKVYYYHFRGDQREWVKNATWYTGREHAIDYSKNPPMDKSDFCTGGWWLASKEALLACDWPDTRLRHRGGDIMSGSAMWQQGYGIMSHHHGVKISDAYRRGYNEPIIASQR